MEDVTLSGVSICVCVCVCTSMESLVQLLLFEAVESKELPAPLLVADPTFLSAQ